MFEQVTPSLGERLSDGRISLFQEDIFSSDHQCNGSVIEVSRFSAFILVCLRVCVCLRACVHVFNHRLIQTLIFMIIMCNNYVCYYGLYLL